MVEGLGGIPTKVAFPFRMLGDILAITQLPLRIAVASQELCDL
ncbi:hypothetical protein L281_13480, partial [Mannheimia haemolytica MhSwine2000]